MKIYTKQGDQGFTRLGNGTQVSKSDLAIIAIGSVDELNSALGIAISLGIERKFLRDVQGQLFQMGADLCLSKYVYSTIEKDIVKLEERIDFFEKFLNPLKNFILPGGTEHAAWLHHTRTICRRAERDVVAYLNELERLQVPLNKDIIIYLNRLSDLLFVMARYNNDYGSGDVVWKNN